MWTKLSKLIPWKTILVVVAILAALYGLFRLGYSGGHDDARRDGDAALSKLQSAFDAYKKEQTELENAALRTWATRYTDIYKVAVVGGDAGYLIRNIIK